MAGFRWEVYDASDDQELGQSGGEVNLEELTPTGGGVWDIGPPNPTAPAEQVVGGVVEEPNGSGSVVRNAPSDVQARGPYSLSSDREIIRVLVLFFALLLGVGLLAVIVNDILHDRLTTGTYFRLLILIAGALTGITCVKVISRKGGQGGGSG